MSWAFFSRKKNRKPEKFYLDPTEESRLRSRFLNTYKMKPYSLEEEEIDFVTKKNPGKKNSPNFQQKYGSKASNPNFQQKYGSKANNLIQHTSNMSQKRVKNIETFRLQRKKGKLRKIYKQMLGEYKKLGAKGFQSKYHFLPPVGPNHNPDKGIQQYLLSNNLAHKYKFRRQFGNLALEPNVQEKLYEDLMNEFNRLGPDTFLKEYHFLPSVAPKNEPQRNVEEYILKRPDFFASMQKYAENENEGEEFEEKNEDPQWNAYTNKTIRTKASDPKGGRRTRKLKRKIKHSRKH